jgi:CHAD domain-containing protein
MRVATRRLRSALATFRPLLDRSVTDPIRDELKWLGGALGGPRDEEVMHARLLDLLAEQPTDLVLGPVRRRVDAELGARHRATHRDLVTELGNARYFRLLDALDDLVATPPLLENAEKDAAAVLPHLVARARRRVLDSAAAVERSTSPDQRDLALHEVRKAAKRARYAGEAVAPVLGGKAARFAAAMEHLQEVLGEHQDSLVTREVLRQLGVQAHLAGENGFTFGRLHGLEVARAEDAEAAYAEALEAVAGKRPRWLR